MPMLPSAIRRATLTRAGRRGVAFIVHVTGRGVRGFVAKADAGLLELDQDPRRAWGFASPAEARVAVDLALGLGAACYQVVIATVGGQA